MKDLKKNKISKAEVEKLKRIEKRKKKDIEHRTIINK